MFQSLSDIKFSWNTLSDGIARAQMIRTNGEYAKREEERRRLTPRVRHFALGSVVRWGL